jgi:transposase
MTRNISQFAVAFGLSLHARAYERLIKIIGLSPPKPTDRFPRQLGAL